jgi:hypothetical protein
MIPYGNLPWPAVVPQFFSVETAWAEAMVEALKDMGESELLFDFNYPRLFARCLVKHRDFAHLIGASLGSAGTESQRSRATDAVAVGISCLGMLANSARHRFWRAVRPRSVPATTEYRGIANVGDAGMLLQRLIPDLQLPSQPIQQAAGEAHGAHA